MCFTTQITATNITIRNFFIAVRRADALGRRWQVKAEQPAAEHPDCRERGGMLAQQRHSRLVRALCK
jgi:hypothetical protein